MHKYKGTPWARWMQLAVLGLRIACSCAPSYQAITLVRKVCMHPVAWMRRLRVPLGVHVPYHLHAASRKPDIQAGKPGSRTRRGKTGEDGKSDMQAGKTGRREDGRREAGKPGSRKCEDGRRGGGTNDGCTQLIHTSRNGGSEDGAHEGKGGHTDGEHKSVDI